MRGTMDWQVHEIFYKSGLDKIGESKHAAKEKAWQDLKISGQKTDSHSIAKFTGIHSYGTAYRYTDMHNVRETDRNIPFKRRSHRSGVMPTIS